MPAKKKTTPPAADQTAGAPAEQPKSRLQEFTSVFDVVADPKFDQEIESQLKGIIISRGIGINPGQRWKRSAYDDLVDQMPAPHKDGTRTISTSKLREQYKLVLTKESKQNARCRAFIQNIGDNAINGTIRFYQEQEVKQQQKQAKP